MKLTVPLRQSRTRLPTLPQAGEEIFFLARLRERRRAKRDGEGIP